LAEIQDEISHQKRLLKDRADEQDRQNTLSQNREDLAKMKQRVNAALNAPRPVVFQRPPPHSKPTDDGNVNSKTSPEHAAPASVQDGHDKHVEDTEAGHEAENLSSIDQWDHSESKDDWNYEKEFPGAKNEALDKLMSLIGKCIPQGIFEVILTAPVKVLRR
jgi:hypothetical protein